MPLGSEVQNDACLGSWESVRGANQNFSSKQYLEGKPMRLKGHTEQLKTVCKASIMLYTAHDSMGRILIAVHKD